MEIDGRYRLGSSKAKGDTLIVRQGKCDFTAIKRVRTICNWYKCLHFPFFSANKTTHKKRQFRIIANLFVTMQQKLIAPFPCLFLMWFSSYSIAKKRRLKGISQ
jgi:hypothetical protein